MSLKKSIGFIAPCPRCGTKVEIIITKRQMKEALKALKVSNSPAQAEILAEKLIGREGKGEFKK